MLWATRVCGIEPRRSRTLEPASTIGSRATAKWTSLEPLHGQAILDITLHIIHPISMDMNVSMTREQLDALAQQIADLSLRIDIAKHSLLTHLRTFDAHNGWAGMGFISTATWLSWRIGIGPAAAREHVRVARALGPLQLVDEAFAAGKLSYAKVRAITRVATAETQQDFIDIAMHATASQIEKLTAAYRRTRVAPSEPARDLRRFVRRAETPSGMVRFEIQLPPEQANVLWEAMLAALDSGRSVNKDVSAETSTAIEPSANLDVPRKRGQTVLTSTPSCFRPNGQMRWSAWRRRTCSTIPGRSGADTSSSS